MTRRMVEDWIVDAILLGVGVIATYLSVKYTWQWQVYTGDPKVEALAYAVVIVGFSTLVFEFAVQAAREKKKWAWLLFVGWALVAAYSMQTTVAGQWIGVRREEAKRADQTSEVARNQFETSALKKKIERLEERLAQVREERARVNGLLGGVSSVEKRQEFRRNSTELEAQLEKLRTSEEEIADEIMAGELELAGKLADEYVSGLTGAGTSVFAFYEEVLKVDAKKVEFGLAVFKGIILDTVNILCFMFVMIRRSKEGDSGMELESVPDEGFVEEERASPKSPVEALADELYRKERRGRFVGRERAAELGVEAPILEEMVRALVRSGTLLRRKGKVWMNPHVGREEFLREVESLGLTS